jgi:uncharacterized membrane protein
MLHIHPALSGMPIAFCLLLCLLELSRIVPAWRNACEGARVPVLLACVVSIIAAFVSGYHASSLLGDLEQPLEDAVGLHHAWGRMALIVALVACALFWIARVATHGRRFFVALYYFALAVFLLLTVWVGHLGGELVFTHDIASSLVPAASPRPEPTGIR